jgi:hypothetical protein
VLEAYALSGCDYSPGIAGIGVVKACALLRASGSLAPALLALTQDSVFDVPDAFEAVAQKAVLTCKYHFVRTPLEGGGMSSVDHLNVVSSIDETAMHSGSTFLGFPLTAEIADSIAQWLCKPHAPYDAVALPPGTQAPPVVAPLAAEPEVFPPSDLASLFGITVPVPKDRLLTSKELGDLLRLHVLDVPGADIFARRSNESLMTSQEQLESFEAKYGGEVQRWPLNKDMKTYLGTRGLDRNLLAAASFDAVMVSMRKVRAHSRIIQHACTHSFFHYLCRRAKRAPFNLFTLGTSCTRRSGRSDCSRLGYSPLGTYLT